MNGFAPNIEVQDPRLLFGHNMAGGLLDVLAEHVQSCQNTQLQGERRAGKSSTLLCLAAKLSSTNRIIPVYVNLRVFPQVVGIEPGYACLVGLVHEAVMHQTNGTGLLPTGVQLPNASISLPRDMSSERCRIELLRQTHLDVSSAFIEYVRLIHGLGQRIALLIDEYEHLVQSTFNGRPGAFHPMRDESSKVPPESPDGLTPLTYVIAGRTPWESVYSPGGSEDFNKTSQKVFVGPIGYDPFCTMWETCAASLSAAARQRLTASRFTLDQVYDFTGGWPAFGKILGANMAAIKTYDVAAASSDLSPHFKTIWKALDQEECQLIVSLPDGGRVEPSAKVLNLADRGLLVKDEGTFRLNGQLWYDFVREKKPDIEQSRLESLLRRYPMR